MKNKIKHRVALLLFLSLTTTYAQIRIEREGQNLEEKEIISKKTDQTLKAFDYKVSQIAVDIQNATVKEKEQLRIQVDSINNLMDTNGMTEERGQELKTKFAKEASDRIEKEVARMQDSLTLAVQSQVNYAMKNGELLKVADTTKRMATVMIGGTYDSHQKKGQRILGERRSNLRLQLMYGISNLETDGAFANSAIRYVPSNFIQFGFHVKTRVLKNNNLLHLRYGIAWEYSNLKPSEHRLFEVQEGQTVLADYDERFTKSRLALGSFQIPIYLEFDFTPKKIDSKTGKAYFISERSWRLGVGGYVNFGNSSGKQVYRYKDHGTYRVKQRTDLGIDKTRFGVGSYVGYRAWALQFQYELTPLFKNNSIEQHVWSLGLRVDI